MFEYIRGILQYKGTDFCVIDVNGVGFKIYTSHITAAGIGDSGSTVTLYTYMNVKEDEISLFGFASREELSVFNMLISVSGVGPKMGIAVLAAMSPSEFSLAVATGDFKAISKSKGVGPKLAQRIVLELKDKIGALDSSEDIEIKAVGNATASSNSKDAIEALVNFGYTKSEAALAVGKLDQSLPADQLIKQALKSLARGL